MFVIVYEFNGFEWFSRRARYTVCARFSLLPRRFEFLRENAKYGLRRVLIAANNS